MRRTLAAAALLAAVLATPAPTLTVHAASYTAAPPVTTVYSAVAPTVDPDRIHEHPCLGYPKACHFTQIGGPGAFGVLYPNTRTLAHQNLNCLFGFPPKAPCHNNPPIQPGGSAELEWRGNGNLIWRHLPHWTGPASMGGYDNTQILVRFYFTCTRPAGSIDTTVDFQYWLGGQPDFPARKADFLGACDGSVREVNENIGEGVSGLGKGFYGKLLSPHVEMHWGGPIASYSISAWDVNRLDGVSVARQLAG